MQMPLPDFRRPTHGAEVRLPRQECEGLPELDLALADLDPFAVNPIGVGDVQVRGQRSQHFQVLPVIFPGEIAVELRMGQVQAHPQVEQPADLDHVLR